jgi:hypothetical protein
MVQEPGRDLLVLMACCRHVGGTLGFKANLISSRSFMNADLRRRTDEVVNRLTQLRDSL